MKRVLALLLLSLSFTVLTAEEAKQTNTGAMFAPPIAGSIIEKIAADPYTYLKLKTDKDETWVAVPTTDLPLGTTVEIMKPVPMMGFESKTLKRKFDRLYFGVLKTQAEAMQKAKDKKDRQKK